MASIVRRGKYCRVQVRMKGFAPQQRTFDAKSQAEAWARSIESEMDRGTFLDRSESEKTSLGEALDRYGREVSSKKRSGPQELRRIRLWKMHPLALRSLASLRGADFAKYRDERLASGRAAATIRLELSLVGHLFETARKEWGMEALLNPLRNISKPPAAHGRERRLEEGEYERIVAAITANCRTPWMRAAFELAIATSLRRSMLVQLRWDWVDLARRVISVPTEFRDVENKGVPVAIPIWPSAASVLEVLPRSIDGRVLPLSPNAIACAWKHVQKAADVTDLRWHDLRHEATSRLFELGMNPRWPLQTPPLLATQIPPPLSRT